MVECACLHCVYHAVQDLYEERRSQFFSNLTDVEQWLEETRAAVQEVLQEEKEVQGEGSEKQAVEVVDQNEVFQGVATLRPQGDSQAAMDILISTLKVCTCKFSRDLG